MINGRRYINGIDPPSEVLGMVMMDGHVLHYFMLVLKIPLALLMKSSLLYGVLRVDVRVVEVRIRDSMNSEISVERGIGHFGEFNLEIVLGQVWIVSADFLQSFRFRLVEIRFSANLKVVVSGTFSACHWSSRSIYPSFEVVVSVIGYVFSTIVAKPTATRAYHLVTSIFFDDFDIALRTGS